MNTVALKKHNTLRKLIFKSDTQAIQKLLSQLHEDESEVLNMIPAGESSLLHL